MIMKPFLAPMLEGFGTSAGLIIAIGIQNAYVLRQGLKKRHVFLVATLCFLGDGILILSGIFGLGALLENHPNISRIVCYLGAAFLLWYGVRAFRSAFQNHHLEIAQDPATTKAVQDSRLRTTLTVFALTLLNPHAYIDTVLVLGGMGASLPPHEHFSFIVGALFASFVWFYSLAFGASFLAPLFKKPIAWKILDVLTGLIMWAVAFSLIFDY